MPHQTPFTHKVSHTRADLKGSGMPHQTPLADKVGRLSDLERISTGTGIAAARPAVVIDFGFANLRAGFAGEAEPRIVMANLVGRGSDGSETVGERGVTNQHPMEERGLLGVAFSADVAETILRHVFDNVLCVSAQGQPVMISEAPLRNKANRERMTQMLFEIFNVPAMYVVLDVVAQNYTEWERTDTQSEVLSVCVGASGVRTAPCAFGCALPHAWMSNTQINSAKMTAYMPRILTGRGLVVDARAAEDVIFKTAYCAADFESEMQTAESSSSLEKPHAFATGESVVIGSERFRSPEMMFRPTLLGGETVGIHEMCFNSMMLSDVHLHRGLCNNVVVSGGPALTPGFADRLRKEIETLTRRMDIVINVRIGSTNDVWKGACGCLSNLRGSVSVGMHGAAIELRPVAVHPTLCTLFTCTSARATWQKKLHARARKESTRTHTHTHTRARAHTHTSCDHLHRDDRYSQLRITPTLTCSHVSTVGFFTINYLCIRATA